MYKNILAFFGNATFFGLHTCKVSSRRNLMKELGLQTLELRR